MGRLHLTFASGSIPMVAHTITEQDLEFKSDILQICFVTRKFL